MDTQKGFTLVETLITIAITSMVAGSVSLIGSDVIPRAESYADTRLVLAALLEARAESMQGDCSDSSCTALPTHTVRISGSAIAIDEVSASGGSSIVVSQIPLSGRSPVSGSTTIEFKPRTGSVGTYAQVAIGMDVIRISPIGQIDDRP